MIGIGIGLFIGGGGSHTGIRLSAATLPENSAEGTAVGTLSVVGGTGTYTFTLTDSAGTRFKVAGTDGVNLQAGATASNAEVAQSYNITVHADNGAGSTFDRTFPITISDVNEATPVITSNGGGSTAAVSIAYNATAVTTVTATDADVSAVITYSISGGADAAKFAINSSTGVLALNSVQVAGDYVVIVQASDGTNTDTQTITVTVNAAPSAPVNTVAPAVTGTETEGETLTSTSGTWTGTATITYAYQWYQAVLDGSDNVVTDMSGVPLLDNPISGATGSTYVLQAGDVGEKIFCYVTATNGVGSASKASNATGLIAAASSDAAETTVFLARTSGLDATHTNAYKALINGLVADGVFAKLDALYLLATADTTTAKLNLVSTSFGLVPSVGPNDAPAFSADHGYTGSINGGSSAYVNTQFNPFTAGGHYSRNSAHIGLWTLTAGSKSTQQRHGWLDGSAATEGAIGVTGSDNSASVNINSAFGSAVETSNSAAGYVVGNRSGSTAEQLYLNGSSAATGTDASVALTDAVNIWFLARDLGGGVNQPSDEQAAVFHFGGSLTGTDVANLNSRLSTFLTAVGAI